MVLSFSVTPNNYVDEIQKVEERNLREWRKHLDKLVITFNQEQNDTNIDNLLKIENQELEKICKTLMENEIKMKKTTDNISSLRNGLNSLIKRTTENEIVIKPADKGSIITVMSPEFYLNMCESHLRNEEYYECIQDNDPSPLLKNRIIAYAKKYKNLLTENEYKTLTQKPIKCQTFTCYQYYINLKN